MSHVYIEKISAHEDQTVTLKGWIYNIRSSGKIHFLQLRDGTAIIQCVMGKNDVSEEVFESAKRLTQESSVEVTGVVRVPTVHDEAKPVTSDSESTDSKKERKKRAPMSDEAKAAMKAKREATIAAKKAAV